MTDLPPVLPPEENARIAARHAGLKQPLWRDLGAWVAIGLLAIAVACVAGLLWSVSSTARHNANDPCRPGDKRAGCIAAAQAQGVADQANGRLKANNLPPVPTPSSQVPVPTQTVFVPVPGGSGGQGAVGPAGAKGDPGEPGSRGPQGLKGDTVVGPQGPSGENGGQGATGPTGPAGPAGAQGDPGPAGAAGADGATGPQGPKGDPGQPCPSTITVTPGPLDNPSTPYAVCVPATGGN